MERLGWATVGAVFGGTAVWAASRFIGSRRQDEGEDATPEIPPEALESLGGDRGLARAERNPRPDGWEKQ